MFLLGAACGLNVVGSNVIDVGYASVIGADHFGSGEAGLRQLPARQPARRHLRAGPYYAYVPFEALMPWRGGWDELPAAHAAAVAFDLLTAGGLWLLGGACAARTSARCWPTRGRRSRSRCSSPTRTPTTGPSRCWYGGDARAREPAAAGDDRRGGADEFARSCSRRCSPPTGRGGAGEAAGVAGHRGTRVRGRGAVLAMASSPRRRPRRSTTARSASRPTAARRSPIWGSTTSPGRAAVLAAALVSSPSSAPVPRRRDPITVAALGAAIADRAPARAGALVLPLPLSGSCRWRSWRCSPARIVSDRLRRATAAAVGRAMTTAISHGSPSEES